jgi:DNA-directed RNA polymerase specialized sigma24 family protein
MPTKKKSKLSKSRQSLAIDYMPLVRMLARYFVAQRPAWQKAAMLPDLEGEGYLALSKAAQTYDKKKLPYPKAYFARAILNAMCKFMKKVTRTPGEKITLAQAEAARPVEDELDHLRLAIDQLNPADQEFAYQRFVESLTLRKLCEVNDTAMRIVSMKNRRLVKEIAALLEIQATSCRGQSHCPCGNNQLTPSEDTASSR